MTAQHRKPAISVVGLGKLGACTAAALASRGFTVIGVDVNERNVNLINRGQAPVPEPGLQERITAAGERLRATTSYEDAVQNSDVTFIIVPTPSEPAGGFSLDCVRSAATEIARVLARKPAYHLVVVTSTVLPGATETAVLPLLEHVSAKRCGVDFGLCYSPEFIAIGSVIHDFLNPDFVLIGEYDQRSGDLLGEVYRGACENSPPIKRMSIVNAELTKISVNTYVTTKITFANLLTELCEQLPGADVDVVADAMGQDRRIGRRYLTGAVSYGGPCFPRDNFALGYLARKVGANAALAEATHNYNVAHRQWLFERVCSVASPGATIAVVGLSYRSGTNIVEEAAGTHLTQQLAASGRRVVVFDEHALEAARSVLGDSVSYAPSLQACVHSADVIVLVSEGDDVKLLRAEDFVRHHGQTPTVIDCWRVCAAQLASAPRINYVPLGVGGDSSALSSDVTEAAS